jgi:hypothetical protein
LKLFFRVLRRLRNCEVLCLVSSFPRGLGTQYTGSSVEATVCIIMASTAHHHAASAAEGNPLFEELVWFLGVLKTLNAETVKDYIVHGPQYYFRWLKSVVIDTPEHFVIETALICFIIWLMFIRKTVDPQKIAKNNRLTKREEDELIDSWHPEPFIKKVDSAAAEVSARSLVRP